MRAENRAEQIMGVGNVRHPVTHRLINSVLKSSAAQIYRSDIRAQQPHPENIQGLAAHILRPHVDFALHSEQGGHRRGRHAVLPCAGLGNDSGFSHAPGQENLTDRIVDFVRACVGQVFPLEIDASPAEIRSDPASKREWSRPSGIISQQFIQLRLETRVSSCVAVRILEFLQGPHQGFGNESASIGTISPVLVRHAEGNRGHFSPRS